MKISPKFTYSKRPLKVYLLRPDTYGARDEMNEITEESVFRFAHENKLLDNFREAFYSVIHMAKRYEEFYLEMLKEDNETTKTYLKQLKGVKRPQTPVSVILHSAELEVYFGAFLISCKAALDKLVPLYSYAYKDNQFKFGAKGTVLLKALHRWKDTSKAALFIELLQSHKNLWIDELIDLRDTYAHFDNLAQHKPFSFEFPGRAWPPRSITDFQKPIIALRTGHRDALEYVKFIVDELKTFSKVMLQLCEYGYHRRPKHSLKCDKCKFAFAEETAGNQEGFCTIDDIQFRIIDEPLGYGLLLCPNCGEENEIDMWKWNPAIRS